MRKIVVALVAALVAVALAGCGGGAEETTEPTVAVTVTESTTTAGTTAAIADTFSDRSPVEGEVYEAFPTLEATETPEPVALRLETNQPMLILFFAEEQSESDDLEDAIDAAMVGYAGLIDLVRIDVSEAATTNSQQRGAIVAHELGINDTPYILMVDAKGYITWRWSGYADELMLEREILRTTQ